MRDSYGSYNRLRRNRTLFLFDSRMRDPLSEIE